MNYKNTKRTRLLVILSCKSIMDVLVLYAVGNMHMTMRAKSRLNIFKHYENLSCAQLLREVD